MEANRRTNTGQELALRSALHAQGLRFRKDLRMLAAGRAVRPDIAFTRAKVAVFVDGCFWHRCPLHATTPRSNADFWNEKFQRTIRRDRENDAALREAGWTVIRVWEHEDHLAAAARVRAAIDQSLGSEDGHRTATATARPQRP